MSTDAVKKWISGCNNTKLEFQLAQKQLKRILDQLSKRDDFQDFNLDNSIQLVESLSFFIFEQNSQPEKKQLISIIDDVWNHILSERDISGSMTNEPMLNLLIDQLRPHLLKTKNEKLVKEERRNVGLNPRLGLSMKEDNLRDDWYKKNEVRYIGLFSFILSKLRHQDISSNIWWIIPGILNLMDDITHFEEIKLPSLFLFNQLLDCFSRDSEENSSDKWISINSTGIFNLFEPLLKNMLFFTPPSFPSNQTISLWTELYPILDKLYHLQYKDDDSKYKESLIKLCNEVILQHSIPRCGLKHEKLLITALDQLLLLLHTVKESSILILQRIIYVFGERLVRDPFFTAFDNVVDKVIEIIVELIEICPGERVIAHRFDLIGLIVIIAVKCDREEKLSETSNRLNRLRQAIKELEKKNVNISDLKGVLMNEEDYKHTIMKLFP